MCAGTDGGRTDLPFRLLCKEQGVGLLSMEMVSAKAISFHNKNNAGFDADVRGRKSDRSADLRFRSGDHAQSAAEIEERPFDILDINMAVRCRK